MGYSIRNLAKYVEDNPDLAKRKGEIMIVACGLTVDGDFMVAVTAEILLGEEHANKLLDLVMTDMDHLEIVANGIRHSKYMKVVNDRHTLLLKKIKKRKMCDRPNYLTSVYKQLVISHKGRTAKGDFRVFRALEEKSRFSVHVVRLLSSFGLHNHAGRLQKQCFR